MKTVKFAGYECRLELDRYQHGGIHIGLIDVEDGVPFCVATSYVPGTELADDEVIIKNYSENEGILDALIEAGIVEKTGRVVHSGFVTMPICRLLVDLTN